MNQRKKRVVIVDDSPIVRERLVRLISDIPDVDLVGEADLAFEAIHRIRSLRPDVVILDISMPGGSGMHVLETIKRDPTSPCIIMLTNFAHPQYREKCRELGADFFFDKSTEFETVTQVIHDFPLPGPGPARPAAA